MFVPFLSFVSFLSFASFISFVPFATFVSFAVICQKKNEIEKTKHEPEQTQKQLKTKIMKYDAIQKQSKLL